MLSYVAKHSKQRKTAKLIKLQLLASILSRNDKNVELRRKTFKTTQNYKSNQITMTCIDLMSKRSKRSKQRKITNAIKLQWICIDLTSIRSKMLNTSQNIQNNAKLAKVIKLQLLASIWSQNDQKCWVTSQNIQNNAKLQKWSNYNDLHRFRCQKHSKQRKTTKVIKL